MNTFAKFAAVAVAIPLLVGCSTAEEDAGSTGSPSPSAAPAASIDPNLPFDQQMARAIEDGEADLVMALLVAGVSLDGQLPNGLPPLHYAAQRGQDEVVIALLVAGPDLEAIDSLGRTPLMVAAAYAGPDAVSALLDAGAEREVFNGAFFGGSPWHYAANYGNIAALQVLLEHGQDINMLDGMTNSTALHWAALNGQLEAVEFLLAAGIDAEVLDNSGTTARAWADFRDEDAIAEAIAAAGGVA